MKGNEIYNSGLVSLLISSVVAETILKEVLSGFMNVLEISDKDLKEHRYEIFDQILAELLIKNEFRG